MQLVGSKQLSTKKHGGYVAPWLSVADMRHRMEQWYEALHKTYEP